jgi:hypothetical protein
VGDQSKSFPTKKRFSPEYGTHFCQKRAEMGHQPHLQPTHRKPPRIPNGEWGFSPIYLWFYALHFLGSWASGALPPDV